MLIVAVADNENPEIKEEDYAAARTAAGVKDNERIVAIVNVGEPAEVPTAKPRQPATAFTTWQP